MPTLFGYVEGNTQHGANAQVVQRSRAVVDPEHARKPFAQELGDLSGTRGRSTGGAGKAKSRNPAVHAAEKSDAPVVPEKPSNKGQPAEMVEERGAAKGNAKEATARRTQGRESASKGLQGVREAARRDRRARFTALLHHVTPQLLEQGYQALQRDAAAGVDGVTWEQYGQELEPKLAELHQRIHAGAYRAQPSRRVYIPKADGKRRALGIAALEDKIVQQAVATVLGAIYEEDFMGFSYGFRPGRSQHDALDAVWVGIDRKSVEWIVDADIAAYFDTIDHDWLMKFLEHRIADRRMLRLIEKWLKAGAIEEGRRVASERGTPQGAVISPLLGNIYLHYVWDLWAHQWRKLHAQGQVIMVRYADDSIVGFADRADAQRFLAEMRERLGKFGLTLNSEKTRLIEFGRNATKRRQARGEGKPETFDFLGFTHICSTSRKGRFMIKRLTMKKRMRATLAAIRENLKRRRHEPVPQTGQWLNRVLRGYYQYHAIPGNLRRLGGFRADVARAWMQSLRRRSQRHAMNWRRMRILIRVHLPSCTLVHAYPSQRLRV